MYIVIEIQATSATQVAVVTPIYTSADRHQAESEFHRLCSVAAVSSVARHTIVLLDDEGYLIEVKSYTHGEG